MSAAVAPTYDGTPLVVADWLVAAGGGARCRRYAPALARHGLEATFAVGLLERPDVDLARCGVWVDDATALAAPQHMVPLRRLVAHWTPLIAAIPTNTTAAVWLSRLPVPRLAAHAPLLDALGFGHLGALRHLQLCDLHADADDSEVAVAAGDDAAAAAAADTLPAHLRPPIEYVVPLGHALALAHCAPMIDIGTQAPPSPETNLGTWLAHLTPPLDRYTKTLELEGFSTVKQLMLAPKERVMALRLIKRGHRRVLWHYVVALRTHWFDPL